MSITFKHLHPRAEDFIGLIGEFISEQDPRSAAEQFNENYSFGGGWRAFKGFAWNETEQSITYPGDPPYKAVAEAKLRDETILVFSHAWVMILQPSGEYEISRMD